MPRPSEDIAPSEQQPEVRPVLAGPALIRGGCLTVRTRCGELDVSAPPRVLRTLFAWCDGRRSLQDIKALAARKGTWPFFEKFVRAMLECGVLVDAHFAALDALAGRHAHSRPVELAGPAACEGGAEFAESTLACPKVLHEVLNELSRAENALSPALDPRLHRVALLLRKPFEGLPPGIFHLEWEDEGLQIHHVAACDESSLLVAMAAPGVVARSPILISIFAGGLASRGHESFPASTAWQVVGAACARMGRKATTVGWTCGSVELRDTAALSDMCLLGSAVPVTTVFLTPDALTHMPTGGEPRREVELHWIDVPAQSPGYLVAQATIATLTTRSARVQGFGRSQDPRLACAIAASEAVERFSLRHPRADMLLSTGKALSHVVEPRTLVQYAADQYRRASPAVVPYRDEQARLWTQATTLADDKARWVPAELVYSGHDLPAGQRGHMLIWQSSSGCASDTDLTVATQRAGLEVIERDALARHWLAQRPGKSLALQALPTLFASQLEAVRAHGYELDVSVLEEEAGPVMLTALTSGKEGFCVVSTACSNSAVASLERALAESLVSALARSAHRSDRRPRAAQCRTPLDHGDLYALRRYHRRAHAVARGGPVDSFSDLERRWPTSLTQRLHAGGRLHNAVWVDMTHADAPLALDGKVIRTVRVLIPGALPVVFGYDALPRGMGALCVVGGRFPHPLA